MKILEDGRDKPWKAVVTCKRCKSKLELEPSDVQYDPGGGWAEKEPCYFYECAVCGGTPELKERDLTPLVMDAARKRTEGL